ncbi:Uncharacterised protein [Chlamydia trachomatis]|nr:Uncharacterised protein [Chlamydia trachomatis]
MEEIRSSIALFYHKTTIKGYESNYPKEQRVAS